MRHQQKSYFSEEDILNYFTQICLALKHCHDRKLLHRDISPDNIFMTRSGLCKLGDFGVSKVLNFSRDKALKLFGNLFYMSPEMF